jgi:hypothetical protein
MECFFLTAASVFFDCSVFLLWHFLMESGDSSVGPTVVEGRNVTMFNFKTALFLFLYPIMSLKSQPLYFKQFWSNMEWSSDGLPILCGFFFWGGGGMVGASFTIQSNISVTGHFWELAL